MSILTKEVIQKILNDDWLLMDDCEGLENCTVIKELARMALAAMDSEPVAVVEPSDYVTAAQLVGEGPARKAVHELYEGALRIGDKLYRHAQTAPVVPEEKPMPNPLSMYAVDAVAAIAEAKGWNACRAAMLQHQPQNAQQNIPENIPGGLVEAVNNLLNNDGSRGCYDAMECGTAREKIELWLAQRQRWEEQRKANLYAGNSPVIPDGYVMVPKEPTERMVIDGFESEPDETFSEPDVWEAYQKMSGCQQAAYRARLCWAAMLASAPQEVKGE